MWKIIILLFLGITARTVKGVTELGDDCASNEDCEDIDNAVCDSFDLCKCTEGYVESSDSTKCLALAVKVGDECTEQEQCSEIPKAECKNNTCVVAQVIPTPPVLAKPTAECTTDSDCSTLIVKRVCKNGTCTTELPSVSPKSILSTLIPNVFILGKPCGNDSDCTGEGSACTDKLCKCKEDFVPAQNLKSCLPKAKSVGDKCTETAQCLSLNGSICENEKCTQKIQQILKKVDENLPTVKLSVGSKCQTDKECLHLMNAVCLENVCQCKDKFIPSLSSETCLKKAEKEGDFCMFDKQCEDIKGATCVMTKCVKPGAVGTRLGTPSQGSRIAISQLLAAILFAKSFFV